VHVKDWMENPSESSDQGEVLVLTLKCICESQGSRLRKLDLD